MGSKALEIEANRTAIKSFERLLAYQRGKTDRDEGEIGSRKSASKTKTRRRDGYAKPGWGQETTPAVNRPYREARTRSLAHTPAHSLARHKGLSSEGKL
jgi:hypothetical protein